MLKQNIDDDDDDDRVHESLIRRLQSVLTWLVNGHSGWHYRWSANIKRPTNISGTIHRHVWMRWLRDHFSLCGLSLGK